MISEKELEKITNLAEYEKHCKEKYKSFFNYLEQEKIEYHFEDKKINIFCRKEIVFDNIELPPITIFNFKKYLRGFHDCNFIMLHNYPNKTLPKSISINSNSENNYIYIQKSPKLQEIPDNFILNGNIKSLTIHETGIKRIGNNIKLPSSLIITNSKLEEIGDNCIIGRDLGIGNDCNIKKIGENIKIHGGFSIQRCKKLPNKLTARDIYVYDSELEEIPDDITISYNLNICNTKVRRLPSSLNSKISKDTKIIINNIIENINEFSLYNFYIDRDIRNNMGNSNDYCSNHLFEIKNSFINKKNNTFDIIDFLTKGYNEENYNDIIFKNILLYYSDFPINRKLLLEQFDEISEQEIKEFIDNKDKEYKVNTKNVLNRFSIENTNNNNNKNEDEWKVKEPLSIKGGIPLIYYCQNKQAFEFLYKNNYHFNKKELDEIVQEKIKNIYEMYLLKSTLIHDNI